MGVWVRVAPLVGLCAMWSACETSESARSAPDDAGSGGSADASIDSGAPPPAWLAYVSEEPPATELRVLDVGAPGAEPLALAQGVSAPRWTRDGRWLVVELDGGQSAVVDFSGPTPGPVLPLSAEGKPVHGCVPAPSSTRLACMLESGGASSRATLVDLGQTPPEVTVVEGATLPTSGAPFLDWGPGSRFAFFLAIASSGYEVAVIDTEESPPSAVALSSSLQGLALWSDSSRLAYSQKLPSPALFVRDLALGTSTQVAADAPSHGRFAFAAQGTALAHANAAGELVFHALATGQSVVVSSGPVTTFWVSADGARALYAAGGENTLLDTTLLPPKETAKVPDIPFCWSPSGRFIAVYALSNALSLFDVESPTAPPKLVSSGGLAPSDCEFQDDLVLTWYSPYNPSIGVAVAPAWQGVELPAEPGPFVADIFSWSSDLKRLAFRDAGSRRLQLATEFPSPQVVELTSGPVGGFALRP